MTARAWVRTPVSGDGEEVLGSMLSKINWGNLLHQIINNCPHILFSYRGINHLAEIERSMMRDKFMVGFISEKQLVLI